ncbi:zinc-ribbon domain-containing protein [uncultured Roseobacter sp.]|uniref:zinc-ribbon domain-containing protein n=1 Tax=uncultured Roseobacter sp. TaxID=114847 RepID=UPI002606B856|nr:zinc-ribbon domain-containing protein [uncultured Roseobacter sp.]
MRLICPNCDAQYEVPDDVMPPDGRDVQCSNCGQTWFQAHPDAEQEEQEALSKTAEEDEEVVFPEEDNAPEPEPEPEPAPEEVTSSDDNPPPSESRPEAEFDEIPPSPTRKPLDPAVADVLREEAELEKKARSNETAGGVESQPDLGLTDADGSDEARKRARETRDRMARMRGEPPSLPVVEATAVSGSRRDLLPDIEEINSTLRSNNERSPGDDPGQTAQVEAREKRSFGRGFVLMVLLAAILALLYVFAPQLAEAVPQADPWLSAYVGIVDQWRMWLDTKVEAVLGWLDATAASSGQ